MTGPSQAFDPPPGASLPASGRILLGATCALLFLAAASGSAGLRGAMLVIASAALLWGRGARLAGDLLELPRTVWIPCVAWGGLAALSVSWSVSPRFSLAELRAEVGYGLLTFAISFVAALTLRRWRAWWIAIVAGTATVFAVQLAQDVLALKLSRHPMDGGPGPWSTHLVLVAPLLLALAWPRPWGFERGVLARVVALVLVLVAAAETANRIVWAAFAVQLAVALVATRALSHAQPAHLASSRRLVVIAALAVVLGFGAAVLERNQRHFRADPSLTASIDGDLRPRLWSVAWEELGKAPWLGHGFGREILEERFLAKTPAPSTGHPPMRHSHNAFVDVALQLGLVGLAAFLAIWVGLAREHLRALREPALAPLGVIGLTMLAGYAVKNLTDDFFYRHNGLVFWALNGLLLGLARAVRGPGRG